MEKKKVWIFGDSYAILEKFLNPDLIWNDTTCDLSYTWPRRLAEKYDVTNLAHSGTGIWWSIDQLKKQVKGLSSLPSKLFKSQQQKDIIVIFFASEYVFRPHFTFFDDPMDSALMKEFTRRDRKWKGSFYKQYVDFIKNFYEYNCEHQEIDDHQNINYVSYYTFLRQLSNKFNKMLVVPIFSSPHKLFGKIENTDKFMIAEGQPLWNHDEKNVNTYHPNHMRQENHDIVYNMMVDWIENNAVFDTKKLLKIS